MKTLFIFLIFSAAAAQAQSWAPAAVRHTCLAQAPATVSPAKAVPYEDRNYSATEEVIRKEYFLSGISVDIPEGEVAYQMTSFRNVFTPEQALRLALDSFLYDHTDPTSPLARVLDSMGAASPTKDQLRVASDHLLGLMSARGSVITLVRSSYTGPRGEPVAGNWIFGLSLGCCRGSYWAVVGRNGAAARSYGTY